MQIFLVSNHLWFTVYDTYSYTMISVLCNFCEATKNPYLESYQFSEKKKTHVH